MSLQSLMHLFQRAQDLINNCLHKKAVSVQKSLWSRQGQLQTKGTVQENGEWWSAKQFMWSVTTWRQENPFPWPSTPLTYTKYQCEVWYLQAPSSLRHLQWHGRPEGKLQKASSIHQYQNNCEGFTARGMAPDSGMSRSLLKRKKKKRQMSGTREVPEVRNSVKGERQLLLWAREETKPKRNSDSFHATNTGSFPTK